MSIHYQLSLWLTLLSLPTLAQLDNSAFEERWVLPGETPTIILNPHLYSDVRPFDHKHWQDSLWDAYKSQKDRDEFESWEWGCREPVSYREIFALKSRGYGGYIRPYMLSKQVGLFAHSFSYFRNLEYFNPTADGKTLLGEQLQVRGAYLLDSNLMISAGLWGRKDFGTGGIAEVRPTLTVRYRQGRFRLLFGTLEGNINHRFLEPLLDYESMITKRLEEGFALQWWGRRTQAELYLDWAQMIYPFEKRQEQLNVGGRMAYRLINERETNLQAIGQFRAYHKGGQLDSSKGKPGLTTVLSPAIGLKLNQELGGLPFDLQAEAHLLATNGIGDSIQIDSRLKAGRAFYGQIGLGNPHWQANVGYWQAKGYYVPGGAPIYSNRTENVLNPGMVLPGDRKLLFIRGQYQWNLSQYRAFATLRAEYIYDQVRKIGDYNYQLYLNIRMGQ